MMNYILEEEKGGELKPVELSNLRMVSNEQKNGDDVFLSDFVFLNSPESRKIIKKEIGINLSALTLPEQANFLQFLYTRTENQVRVLKRFVDKYGENGFKSFLSLEQDPGMGEKIIAIGEKLDSKNADRVFARYSEIVDITEDMRQVLQDSFNQAKDVSDDDINSITSQVLVKASCLLVEFSKRLEVDDLLDDEEILETLEEYRTDMLFTFSAFRSLRGKVELEDLKGVSFEKVPTEDFSFWCEQILKLGKGEKIEISESDERLSSIRDMFRLYERNYRDRPKFKKILMQNFAQALVDENKDIKINIVKQNGKVVAFNRVEEVEDKKKLFGSCNVLSSAQALSVGGALFNRTKEEYFKDSEVSATCDAFSPISSMYIEKGQFVVEKIDTESDPDNIPWFVIKREKDEEQKYYYQGEESSDLIREFESQEKNIDKLSKLSHFILSFDQASQEIKNTSIDLVNNQGYKITRYFRDRKTKKVYLAFERGSN